MREIETIGWLVACALLILVVLVSIAHAKAPATSPDLAFRPEKPLRRDQAQEPCSRLSVILVVTRKRDKVAKVDAYAIRHKC